jgi:hypothetical protein
VLSGPSNGEGEQGEVGDAPTTQGAGKTSDWYVIKTGCLPTLLALFGGYVAKQVVTAGWGEVAGAFAYFGGMVIVALAIALRRRRRKKG